MKKSDTVYYTYVVILCLISIYLWAQAAFFEIHLKSNTEYAKGVVTRELVVRPKQTRKFAYKYIVNGKEYKGKSRYIGYALGDTITIAYDRKYPAVCRFKKENQNIPIDSLYARDRLKK